ncbi:hypothetical protein [Pseudoxanthomonas mexicana]
MTLKLRVNLHAAEPKQPMLLAQAANTNNPIPLLCAYDKIRRDDGRATISTRLVESLRRWQFVLLGNGYVDICHHGLTPELSRPAKRVRLE